MIIFTKEQMEELEKLDRALYDANVASKQALEALKKLFPEAPKVEGEDHDCDEGCPHHTKANHD